MIQRDIYLMNAAYLFAKAEAEKDSAIRGDFENMARAYLRLADQAVRNAQNDIVTRRRLPKGIAIDYRHTNGPVLCRRQLTRIRTFATRGRLQRENAPLKINIPQTE